MLGRINARLIGSLLLGYLGVSANAQPAAPAPFYFTNTSEVALYNRYEAIRKLSRRLNGDWRLDLVLGRGRRYVIDASTDLRQWTPLTNFVSATNKLRWIDAGSRSVPRRFYRVVPRGFNLIGRLPDGSLDLLLGVKPGREYVIETSTNHKDWMLWQRFFSPGPVLRFQHQAPSAARSFVLRARQTGLNPLQLQADGTYLLVSTQTCAEARLVEVSTDLHDWSVLSCLIARGPTRMFAPSDSVSVQPLYRVTSAPVNEVYDAFIILGQSNAVGVGDLTNREPSDPSVWMLGLDYQFKVAYEPVHDSTGQLDTVNLHPDITTNGRSGHSWSLRAAKSVTAALGNRIVIIPCAAGGTSIQQWLPGTNRYDRSTLFGAANYRRTVAAPGGLKSIWYYGHESNCHPRYSSTYTADWKHLVSELRADYGPVPIIYAQLARSGDPGGDGLPDWLHAGAEKQRLMETGSGDTNALPEHFMVVTFDLPMQDYIHLNRAGVDVLAARFGRATRQHVYGHTVNGTGPRLVSLTHPGGDKSQIRVKFSRSVNEAIHHYDDQFRVYDQDVEAPVKRVERDLDATAVLITLETEATGQVEVSYGGRMMDQLNTGLPNVIKDSDGLPAPMFRRLPVAPEPIDP